MPTDYQKKIKAKKSVDKKSKEYGSSFMSAMDSIISKAHAPTDVPRQTKKEERPVSVTLKKSTRPEMDTYTVKGGKTESGLELADTEIKKKPFERVRKSDRTKDVVKNAKLSDSLRGKLRKAKDIAKKSPTKANMTKLRKALNIYKKSINIY